MSLKEIEDKARAFAEANDRLAELVEKAQEEIVAVKQGARPAINRALKSAATRKAELHAALKAAPELFEKPRTHVFHSIKVGYQKAVGKIEFDDADRVVALIEKHFPDQADVLVKVEKTPIRKALEALGGDELKKIGVRVTDTGDVVVIKAAQNDLEKVVDALFKDLVEDAEVE